MFFFEKHPAVGKAGREGPYDASSGNVVLFRRGALLVNAPVHFVGVPVGVAAVVAEGKAQLSKSGLNAAEVVVVTQDGEIAACGFAGAEVDLRVVRAFVNLVA